VSLFSMVVVFSALFSYFYIYQPDFQKFFNGYLDRQLLPTLSGEREQSGSAMMSLLEMLKQLAIPMLVLAILTIRRKSVYY